MNIHGLDDTLDTIQIRMYNTNCYLCYFSRPKGLAGAMASECGNRGCRTGQKVHLPIQEAKPSHLHELAGHPRLVFLQSPPRFCFPNRGAHTCILSVPALGLHALIEE
jgi:hypothetical protein